jgi:hypothetical protein
LIAFNESSITHGPEACRALSHALLSAPLVIFSFVAFSYASFLAPAFTLASSTIVTSAFAPSGAGARRRSESFETMDDLPEHGLPHITIKHAAGRAVEAFVCVSSRKTLIRWRRRRAGAA